MTFNKNNYKDEDLIGIIFGKLTVLNIERQPGKDGKARIYCRVRCVCGKEKLIYKLSLTRNKTRSCGCINRALHLRKPNNRYQTLYNKHLTTSASRGYISELSFEQFEILSKSNCYYCGIEPSNTMKASSKCSKEWIESSKQYYNGIDRKDNNMGYILNNVLPCCGQCNRMKLNYSYEEFIKRIENIYENHIRTKEKSR